MRIDKWVISLLLGLFVLLGCTDMKETGQEQIDIASAFARQVDLKASDYFTKVRYIPLETTDESIIGKGAEMQFLGDKILITTSQNQCLLFDKNTGKYLATVGHQGEDPEGYQRANAWVNHQTEIIYLESFNNAWVSFDGTGHFQKRISIPDKSKGEAFDYIDADTYITYLNGILSDGTEDVVFFREDAVLKRIQMQEMNEDNTLNPANIQSVSVLRGGEEGYKQFGSPNLKGIINLDFKEPDQGFMQLIGVTRFWHQGEDLFYKGNYNDTIYQVKQQELIPVKVLDLGEYHWPFTERFNKKHDHSFYITNILESDNLMLLRFVRYLLNGEKRAAYNAVIKKKTGEVKISPIEKGFENDLIPFMPLHPYTVSTKGEYGGMIQAFDIVEWFEENANGNIPSEIRHLKDVEEEDNPVIVLFE